MSVRSDRRLRWLSIAVVLVALAGVAVVGVGTVAALFAVATAAAGESLLLAVLQVVVPVLLAFAALSILGVVLLALVVVRAVRLAELPRSERLGTVARGVERRVPWLEEGNVSERVAPTVADRHDALKQRYANDELTERELERELEALLREHGDPETDWPTVDAADGLDRELANGRGGIDAGDREVVHEPNVAESERDRGRDEAASFERERR